jgi:hypothetical protein
MAGGKERLKEELGEVNITQNLYSNFGNFKWAF